MLIATVPYVGKRLHLESDPEPDPKLITDPDPDMQIISDPAGSGSTTLRCMTSEGAFMCFSFYVLNTALQIYIWCIQHLLEATNVAP